MIRQINLPKIFFCYTRGRSFGADAESFGIDVEMTSEELRPEFLRLALVAQTEALKERYKDDLAFSFIGSEDEAIERALQFAYGVIPTEDTTGVDPLFGDVRSVE